MCFLAPFCFLTYTGPPWAITLQHQTLPLWPLHMTLLTLVFFFFYIKKSETKLLDPRNQEQFQQKNLFRKSDSIVTGLFITSFSFWIYRNIYLIFLFLFLLQLLSPSKTLQVKVSNMKPIPTTDANVYFWSFSCKSNSTSFNRTARISTVTTERKKKILKQLDWCRLKKKKKSLKSPACHVLVHQHLQYWAGFCFPLGLSRVRLDMCRTSRIQVETI